MHSVTLLHDLAVVMIVAGAVALICRWLKQPVVLGFLIAGFVIGPSFASVNLVKDRASVETLAEIGLVFLMFSLGLEFSLRKLFRVGLVALFIALSQIIWMIWLGFQIGSFFGWEKLDSLFLGAIICIPSTMIIVTTLRELGKMHEKFTDIIFGILVVQDILAILLMALLSSIAMTGTLEVRKVTITGLKLGIFITAVLIFGLLAVPRLLRLVTRFNSQEVLLMVVIGSCFGMALMAHELGYSIALGSFVTGAVMAETRFFEQIENLIRPIRDLFSAVFFTAIGMMFDPRVLYQHWGMALTLIVAVVFGQIFIGTVGSFLCGFDLKTSSKVGMGMAQIGEFSFIIAQLGMKHGVTDARIFPVIVSVSIFTSFLTPFLMRSSDLLLGRALNLMPQSARMYLSFYTRWIKALRLPGTAGVFWKLSRKSIGQIIMNLMVISAILIIAGYLESRWSQFHKEPYFFRSEVSTVCWLAGMLVSLPFIVATWRKYQAVVMILVESLVPSRNLQLWHMINVRWALIHTLVTVGTLGLGIWLMMFTAPFLPPLHIVAALVLFVILFLFWRWKELVKLYSKFQVALSEAMPINKPDCVLSASERIHETLERYQDWDVEILELFIPAHSPIVGRTIAESNVGAITGATIVAIQRHSFQRFSPDASTVLFPGDRLLLVGDAKQLQDARKYIQESRVSQDEMDAVPSEFEDLDVALIEIPEGSAANGQTLAQMQIRRNTGANVIGLQKGTTRIHHPDLSTTLSSRDVLLVMGAREQLHQVQLFLQPGQQQEGVQSKEEIAK